MNSFRIGRLSIILYKDWALFEIIKPYSFGVPPEYIVHIGPLTLAWKVTGRKKNCQALIAFSISGKSIYISLGFLRLACLDRSGSMEGNTK
ncbi:MAG: hypothetical protein WBB55_00800 [Anaerolineales bacterium]